MSRFRRVAQLWNWLPAFRGVAEHENVHEAARTLGISPSALSRTVKQLESAVGAALFVRANSGLALTELGAELLAVTRSVMRQVDDCIAKEEARRGGEGPLFVGATSDLGAVLVARARTGLGSQAPLHVRQIDEEAARQELLRGDVDLAVTTVAPRAPEVEVSSIGEARFGIYAAHDHPLVLDPDTILTNAQFVASGFGPAPSPGMDIACYCDSIEVARVACETSTLLCVLPDLLVAGSRSLHRVADAGDPVTLFAVRRVPLSPTREDARLGQLVESLRRTIAAAG